MFLYFIFRKVCKKLEFSPIYFSKSVHTSLNYAVCKIGLKNEIKWFSYLRRNIFLVFCSAKKIQKRMEETHHGQWFKKPNEATNNNNKF